MFSTILIRYGYGSGGSILQRYEWASQPPVFVMLLPGLASDLPWDAPVSSLSGGQRRRVALAALLIQEWGCAHAG